MTVWWVTAFTGVALMALVVVGAPLVSWYFAEPLNGILRVMSFVFLLEYLASPGLIIAQRELDFNRIAAVQMGSGGLSLLSTFVFVFVMPDVRCLVASELLRVVAVLSLSYFVLPYRPTWRGSVQALREMLRQGKHLYVAGVAIFLMMQGDVFVVGRMCGTGNLGLYRLAATYGMLPTTFISNVVNRTLFPAYGKIQDDPARLKRGLLRAQRFVVALTAPICIGVAGLAPAVAAVGGAKYAGMVFPMQMFAVSAYACCLNAINTALLVALGRSHVLSRVTLIQLVMVAASVVPLTWLWGIKGTVMIYFLQFPIWVMIARDNGRTIGCGVRAQVANQLFIVFPALAMGAAGIVCWTLLRNHVYIYAATFAAAGCTAYLLTLLVISPVRVKELFEVMKQAAGIAPQPRVEEV
jgi:O-antigen/teichoic acid export membrane protein